VATELEVDEVWTAVLMISRIGLAVIEETKSRTVRINLVFAMNRVRFFMSALSSHQHDDILGAQVIKFRCQNTDSRFGRGSCNTRQT